MKKSISLLLVGLMLCGALAGCGGSNDSYGADGAAQADNGGEASGVSGAITVISREDGSGTRGAFVELTGVEEKNDAGEKVDNTTAEAEIANKTDVVLTSVAGNESAIGYVSLGALNETVKAVQVDGVEATVENVKSGDYTLSRPFNIATKGEPTGVAKDFINFIMSAEGQAIVEEQFDAVYIAIGAHNDKKLGIEGEDSQGVYAAVQLLRDIGEGRAPDFKGKRVCVVGGGNVSMDATRTAIRLGAESVTCIYRRRVADMTALAEEIEDAQSEGCQILPLQAPDHIEADENGHVTALWTRPQIISEYGSDGRPRPKNAREPLFRIPCDIVIVAIGQAIDAKPFEQVTPVVRGKIQAESDAFVPNTPHVFAGGDAVTGPATVIRAVAAGKVAAANIDQHLGYHHVITVDVDIPPAHLTNSPACGRVELKNRPLAECIDNFELVKCGMTEEEAQQETSRCLRCDHFGYGIFKGGRTSKW